MISGTAAGESFGSSRGGKHALGWRDVFDIAVRWRQVSEPNDPVWWIDRLVPEVGGRWFGSAVWSPVETYHGLGRVSRMGSGYKRLSSMVSSRLFAIIPTSRGEAEAQQHVTQTP
jgi:hypothetical protein